MKQPYVTKYRQIHWTDVVTAMCFSPYAGSAVTIDHENTVKAYSVAPSMLGRGHTLVEPNGPIWVRVLPCCYAYCTNWEHV